MSEIEMVYYAVGLLTGVITVRWVRSGDPTTEGGGEDE